MPGEVYDRIIFNCDHEFLYLIQENETGTILFMGAMSNPTL
jgi:serine protease inhibitor